MRLFPKNLDSINIGALGRALPTQQFLFALAEISPPCISPPPLRRGMFVLTALLVLLMMPCDPGGTQLRPNCDKQHVKSASSHLLSAEQYRSPYHNLQLMHFILHLKRLFEAQHKQNNCDTISFLRPCVTLHMKVTHYTVSEGDTHIHTHTLSLCPPGILAGVNPHPRLCWVNIMTLPCCGMKQDAGADTWQADKKCIRHLVLLLPRTVHAFIMLNLHPGLSGTDSLVKLLNPIASYCFGFIEAKSVAQHLPAVLHKPSRQIFEISKNWAHCGSNCFSVVCSHQRWNVLNVGFCSQKINLWQHFVIFLSHVKQQQSLASRASLNINVS